MQVVEYIPLVCNTPAYFGLKSGPSFLVMYNQRGLLQDRKTIHLQHPNCRMPAPCCLLSIESDKFLTTNEDEFVHLGFLLKYSCLLFRYFIAYIPLVSSVTPFILLLLFNGLIWIYLYFGLNDFSVLFQYCFRIQCCFRIISIVPLGWQLHQEHLG